MSTLSMGVKMELEYWILAAQLDVLRLRSGSIISSLVGEWRPMARSQQEVAVQAGKEEGSAWRRWWGLVAYKCAARDDNLTKEERCWWGPYASSVSCTLALSYFCRIYLMFPNRWSCFISRPLNWCKKNYISSRSANWWLLGTPPTLFSLIFYPTFLNWDLILK